MKFNSPFWHKLFGTTEGNGQMQPKEAVAFSITGFAQNLICTIIGSYLMIFMTDAIGFSNDMTVKLFGKAMLGPAAVAFLMLLARVYDAVNDPVMGGIVDKTRSKWGKCRPYLKWMAIPISIVTIICFLPVYPANKTGFIIMSLIYLIWGSVYSVADVPYWGLSTAMTNDTEVRGKLLTVARLMCTLGAGVVTVFVPIITNAVSSPYLDDNGYVLSEYAQTVQGLLKNTYFIIAIVIAVISIPMFYYGFRNTRERYTAEEKPQSMSHNIKLLFKNRPLLLLMLAGILGSARAVYMGAGGLYFAKYALASIGGEKMYSVITMAVVPGGLVASVLVPYFTKKFGKKKTFIFTHLVGGIVMFVMFFAGYKSTAGLIINLIGLVILGVPQGISNVMIYAMIGDSVEYLEWKTGERAEGVCFSMQTFINKIGMAVSAFIGVLAYGMSGVKLGNVQGSINEAGLDKLWWMIMLIGAVSMLLMVIPLLFDNFTEDKQRQAVKEIEERKAAKRAAASQQ